MLLGKWVNALKLKNAHLLALVQQGKTSSPSEFLGLREIVHETFHSVGIGSAVYFFFWPTYCNLLHNPNILCNMAASITIISVILCCMSLAVAAAGDGARCLPKYCN